MASGSVKGLHLVVADVRETREALAGRGVEVGEVEEHGRGVKFVHFRDPDGNSWALQEMPWRSREVSLYSPARDLYRADTFPVALEGVAMRKVSAFTVLLIAVAVVAAGTVTGLAQGNPSRYQASLLPTVPGIAPLAAVVNVSALSRVVAEPRSGVALADHAVGQPAANAPGHNAIGTGSITPKLAISVGTVLTNPLSSSDNPFGLTPPDMGLAVGSGDEVQMVNIVGRIWTGTTPGAVFDLRPFFGAPANSLSDPWIIFDQPSGRFIAGIFDITLGGEDFAISKTSNPAGSWSVYHIKYPGVAGGGCPDQGKGGVDDNVIALAFNEFSTAGCSGGTFLGAVVEVFNKAQMLAGAAVSFVYTAPNAARVSLIPAQSMTSTTTEFFASLDNPSGTKLHRLTSTGVPPAAVTLTALADLTVGAYASPPAAPQAGTRKKVDSGDDRVQHVVWSSNTLVLAASDKCKPAGDTMSRACARVIAVNTSTGILSMNTDIASKGHYFYYPAPGINSAGQVVVVFADSSSTTFPQVLVTAAPIAGAFATPVLVQAGTKPNTTGRYGDYFAVAIDPASPTKAWVAGEVGGPLTGPFKWNTAVVQVTVI